MNLVLITMTKREVVAATERNDQRSLAIDESECSNTLFQYNISDKSVYVSALQGYNEIIEEILSSRPINHERLEYFQAATENCKAYLRD